MAKKNVTNEEDSNVRRMRKNKKEIENHEIKQTQREEERLE